MSLMATLWGELAKDSDIQPGTVIAVKGAKVSDFGGKSLNISKDTCTMEFDPKDQEKT